MFIAQKVCTSCSRTSYKIIPITTLNKYLHDDISETEVNINLSVNNGSGKKCNLVCLHRYVCSALYLKYVFSFLMK